MQDTGELEVQSVRDHQIQSSIIFQKPAYVSHTATRVSYQIRGNQALWLVGGILSVDGGVTVLSLFRIVL